MARKAVCVDSVILTVGLMRVFEALLLIDLPLQVGLFVCFNNYPAKSCEATVFSDFSDELQNENFSLRLG